jgi:Lrp/AsnC family leucine-responsive transcriptional regulator
MDPYLVNLTLFIGLSSYNLFILKFSVIKMNEKDLPQGKSLDRIDLKILDVLQHDGRITNANLSEQVGLSATPCSERVKTLERLGYIESYNAKLNPDMLHLELLVFVEITLMRTSPDVFAQFSEAVVQLPQILECHLVSGNFDYLLKARVADMAAYRELLGETLLTLPGVSDSRTYVVMEEVKDTQSIPITV